MKRVAIFDPEALNSFMSMIDEIVAHFPVNTSNAVFQTCIAVTILSAFQMSINDFDYQVEETEDNFTVMFKHEPANSDDILSVMFEPDLEDNSDED